MHVEHSVLVERPIEEVFAYTTDPASWPDWAPTVVRAELLSDGPIGVGSRIQETTVFLGRTMTELVEVIAHEPPHRHWRRGTGGPMPFEMRLSFERDGEGTRVTVRGETEPGGFFKLAEPLFARKMRQQIAANAASLKRVLEELP